MANGLKLSFSYPEWLLSNPADIKNNQLLVITYLYLPGVEKKNDDFLWLNSTGKLTDGMLVPATPSRVTPRNLVRIWKAATQILQTRWSLLAQCWKAGSSKEIPKDFIAWKSSSIKNLSWTFRLKLQKEYWINQQNNLKGSRLQILFSSWLK